MSVKGFQIDAALGELNNVALGSPPLTSGDILLYDGAEFKNITSLFTFVTATGAGSPAIVHNATVDEDVILVDASAGDVTIQLHAAALSRRRPLNIKRIDASANVVTVIPDVGSPAETIDGVASKIISSQYDNLTIINDGTVWWWIL